MPPRYVAIANPDGKRWQAYSRELSAFWGQRGVTPEVEVVPWAEVTPRDGNLDGLPAFDRPAVVRLESPGRDWLVYSLMLRAGSREEEDPQPPDWMALPYQKGKLVHPGLFYRGFRRILTGLRASFDRRPHLTPTADPLDVALMFDKNATVARLEAAGIPCPPTLLPPPADNHDLFTALGRARWPTTYVKLNTGSSASAIAVVRSDGREWSALSSVALLADGAYSTRRLCRHTGADLWRLLNILTAEGVCVQRGIRMAQVDSLNCDLRVVVIHGRPAFTLFRLSPLPMTNLHLGGRRGDFAACRAQVPTRAWLDALDHCVEAAACFQAAAVGVDLLFESGYLRHHVLEVNAFGDFFPGLTDTAGRSVHRVEIEGTARAMGWLA
jgi:hypothetical protein